FIQALQLPIQEEINELQKVSLVSNIEQNTFFWLHALVRFNKSCGIFKFIELIDSVVELETYLC
ncbi:797_t:CDS:1, partial [Cetraspora pellucida]